MKKFLTCLLYGLPVIFFGVCYFLMTVWGEDIIQGAGTAPDVWNDIVGAFRHNSRLSDMYAWTVINFFDFQYSFGVDTIFRLIDVAMATGIIYLLASLILGRWPRLQLKDSLVFALSFLVILVTPHGYTLYRGFSVIHNYLIIGLATVAFGLPFVRSLAGQKVPKIYQKWWFALIIGLIFGMSSNITPIAFLISFVLVKLWQMWQFNRKKSEISEKSEGEAGKVAWKIPAWQGWMLAGMVITVAVAYIFGAGVSTYANNPVYTETYDYLAFSEILTNFGGSLVRVVKHIVVNFGYSFGLILGMAMILGGLAWVTSKVQGRKFRILPTSSSECGVVVGCVVFATIYLLCGSQIMLPVRLALPAYLALVVALGVLVYDWWIRSELTENVAIGVLMAVLMVAMVIIKADFALEYRAQMAQVLTAIEAAPDEVVCISPEIARPKKLPFINLGQDETFAEWALLYMTVYGKEVRVCE